MLVRSAEVVPWEPGSWAVSVRYDNGDGEMYPVGSREQAEAEARKLLASAKIEAVK